MPKQKLKWVCSYETLKFDTPDGDIDSGQFCRYRGKFLVRLHPKNNRQWSRVAELDTSGMKEIFLVEGENMYYDVFSLPDGRLLRLASRKEEYNSLRSVKNYPQPTKEVTDSEISFFTKDDHLWQ